MAVYDCFTLFDELDVLEIRLEEMAPAVDLFVIAEATRDPQGRSKPLHYHENRSRYARFASKIRHVVVDELGENQPAERERSHREALRTALADVGGDSTVLISDVGEIIKPRAIRVCEERRRFVFFDQSLSYYRIDLFSTKRSVSAFGAPAQAIRQMPSLSAPLEVTPKAYLSSLGQSEADIIRNAGWRFSWLGGLEQVRVKLEAYAHTVDDPDRWRGQHGLKLEMDSRRFFATGVDLVDVLVDRSFPRAVLERRSELERAGLLAVGKSEPKAGFLSRLLSKFSDTNGR